MTELRIVNPGDPDEAHDEQKAKDVGNTLARHYPGHLWMVEFTGRVLIVRHEQLSEFVRYRCGLPHAGYVIKHLDSHSAKDLAKHAIEAGGALLELFGLKRGAWDGSEPKVPTELRPRDPNSFTGLH